MSVLTDSITGLVPATAAYCLRR